MDSTMYDKISVKINWIRLYTYGKPKDDFEKKLKSDKRRLLKKLKLI